MPEKVFGILIALGWGVLIWRFHGLCDNVNEIKKMLKNREL